MALFGSDKTTIGVDIGSSSVKIVSLKNDKSGSRWVLDCAGEYPLPPEAIVDGSVMNTGAVVEAIKENLLENRIQAKNANISVSGNAVIIKRIQLQKMTFDELEELPGVGHKTASVVMSQGFGYPAFPVDTHIHRLAQRWGLTNGKSVIQTEKDLKKIFPKKFWNRLHLQIIWYGREYCKARDCYGITCKICKSCYPNRKKPIKTKKA